MFGGTEKQMSSTIHHHQPTFTTPSLRASEDHRANWSERRLSNIWTVQISNILFIILSTAIYHHLSTSSHITSSSSTFWIFAGLSVVLQLAFTMFEIFLYSAHVLTPLRFLIINVMRTVMWIGWPTVPLVRWAGLGKGAWGFDTAVLTLVLPFAAGLPYAVASWRRARNGGYTLLAMEDEKDEVRE